MHLANPHALWLLLLLPLLWLRRRRPPRSRVRVGNLYLWTHATRLDPSVPWRRVHRHRLVLLQAAFLTAVVVALARPTLAFGGRVVAIVVETSIAMGARQDGTTRMEAARQRVRALLDELPRGTAVRLVEAEAAPRLIGEFAASDPALGAALGSLRATDTAADIETAIDRARNVEPPVAWTYVFAAGARPGGAGGARENVEWIQIAKPIENVAITGLSVRRIPSAPSRIELLVEVRNSGGSAVQSDVALTVGSADPIQMPLTVPAGATSTALTTIPAVPAVVTARIDVPDGLEADNTRWIVIGADRLRVRFQGNSYFVDKALAAHPGVTLVDAAPYDAIVCEGCQDLPSGDAGAIVFPSRSGAADAVPLTVVNRPFAGPLALDGLSVIPIQVGRADDEGSVVARAGGLPAILARELGARRIVELRFDPDTSALALSPEFPILIATALEWVATATRNQTSVAAGEPLQWAVPGPGDSAAPLVVGPDGQTVDASVADGRLIVTRTSRAGVYRVRFPEGEREFVVNPATGGDPDVTHQAAGGADDEQEQFSWGNALHSEAAGALLFLALLLLSLEWHWTGRRRHV